MGEVFRTPSTFDADMFCCVAGHGMKISGSGTISTGSGGSSRSGSELGQPPAVEVRHAFKSFGKYNPVLEDLCMTVDQGSIFSLLGSSGSGKTTLLNCCVGLQKLDKGTIMVFGSPPGSQGSGVPGRKIGYMPQELSLYNEFSIQESLKYYGRLYGMSNTDISESMHSILKLLDLPSPSRRISTLSGGQKRRVSFSIATFHKPRLLILDEPTVGVDPILREQIWLFLRQLVATQKTTVIITSHYIAECAISDKIGLMRNGRLLVENSPQELMAQYRLPDLEQVILALCKDDSRSIREDPIDIKAQEKKNKKSSTEILPKTMPVVPMCPIPKAGRNGLINPCYDVENQNFSYNKNYNQNLKNGFETNSFSLKQKFNIDAMTGPRLRSYKEIGSIKKPSELEDTTCCTESTSSIYRITALTIKNFLLLLRSVWFLLFIFVVPAVQIILICLAIGPDPKDLGMGVVNDEMLEILNNPNYTFPEIGNATIDKGMLGVKDVCPPNLGSGCGVSLSCKYLSMLPHDSLALKSYPSTEKATEDIRDGKIWGYIYFPQNYSAYLIDRGGNPAFALEETYDGSRISFEMDMSSKFKKDTTMGLVTDALHNNSSSSSMISFQLLSNTDQQIGHSLKRIFVATYYNFLVQVALDCGFNPRQVELPLNFKDPLYGSDGTSFSEFLAPSVFLGLLFFFPLCSSGISYISERKSGTLSRTLLAGVTTTEIMVAFLISQLAVLLVQSALAFVILTLVFKIQILGSVPLGVALAVLVGIGGMSMGFLISVICQEEIHAVLLAIGSFFPNFLLAGMVWPIQGMPIILQYIAYLLPCTLACESMRSIVSRGWGFSHKNVYPGFISTVGWIIIYWVLTILLQHYKSKK